MPKSESSLYLFKLLSILGIYQHYSWAHRRPGQDRARRQQPEQDHQGLRGGVRPVRGLRLGHPRYVPLRYSVCCNVCP